MKQDRGSRRNVGSVFKFKATCSYLQQRNKTDVYKIINYKSIK